jgi:DNA-binding beta-propeller fold protein YncE
MRLLLSSLLCVGFAAAQNTIVVGHKHADSVGFYDARTGKTLATVGVGVRPHEMAFSQDGREIFVTNYGVERWTQAEKGTNFISVIDAKYRKASGDIILGEYWRPHGIERGRSGLLYVTTDFPGAVLVIDPKIRKVNKAVEVGQQAPHMIAITEDESRAFVANAGSASMSIVPLKGGGTPIAVKVGGIPMGVILNKAETFAYVTTRTGNQVAVIDTKTGKLDHTLNIPGHPVRLKFTPDEKLLIVTLIESGEVAIVDTATRKEVQRFPCGTHNEGIHIDAAANHLYISAQGDNKVCKIDMTNWKQILQIPTSDRPDPILQY